MHEFEAVLYIAARLPPSVGFEAANSLGTFQPQFFFTWFTAVIDPPLAKFVSATFDAPLNIINDESIGKNFIGCGFNQHGKSNRSPWSNVYLPQSLESGLYYP